MATFDKLKSLYMPYGHFGAGAGRNLAFCVLCPWLVAGIRDGWGGNVASGQ